MSDAVNLSHQIICDELLRLKTDLARRAGKQVLLLRTLAPRPKLWNPARIGARCVEMGAATWDPLESTCRHASLSIL